LSAHKASRDKTKIPRATNRAVKSFLKFIGGVSFIFWAQRQGRAYLREQKDNRFVK
jgi:hypothetical protein